MDLASYYHRFVNNFSSITSHLMRLAPKEVLFVWLDKYEDSFQNHKTLLTTTLILSLSIEGKDFILFFDSSLLGLGVVLMHDRNFITFL